MLVLVSNTISSHCIETHPNSTVTPDSVLHLTLPHSVGKGLQVSGSQSV